MILYNIYLISIDRSNDIILLLDGSGSMSAVHSQVESVISAIVNALTIGEFTSRVALAQWNYGCGPVRFWDFDSPICHDKQQILNGLTTVQYPSCFLTSSNYDQGVPYAGFFEAQNIFREQNR